eukprot:992385_1
MHFISTKMDTQTTRIGESDNDLLLEGQSMTEGTEPTRPRPITIISPHLVRPFAVVVFFHEALRIRLKNLNKYITQWNETKDPDIPRQLCKSFKIIARNIDIHTQ